MSTTVAELQAILQGLLDQGKILPHSEVMLVVNEDFAELDYLDPNVPDYRNDNPNGQLWLLGFSDEAQATTWTLSDIDSAS